MSEPKVLSKIMGVNITITWTDGRSEQLMDLPEDVSKVLEDYLTDLEIEVAHEHAMKYGEHFDNRPY